MDVASKLSRRYGSHALWQQVPLAAHGAERSKTALALLRVAEDLLVSGRYTAARRSPVQHS
jgi:hypothetical protein